MKSHIKDNISRLFYYLAIATFIVIAPIETPLHATTLSPADLFTTGDALLTSDSVTGLDWLDLTETIGLSKTEILGGAGPSGGWLGSTLGFRYATVGEIISLWTNHGFPDINAGYSEANSVGGLVMGFFSLLGETSPYSPGKLKWGTYGLAAGTPQEGFSDGGWVWVDTESQYTELSTIGMLTSGGVGAYNGSWLVRDTGFTPPPIPEPTTLLLLGTGLVGLVGFRKKFKK